MGLNPIIRFELIRTARRSRHYVMGAALGLVPVYVAWVLYEFGAQAAAMNGGHERSIGFRFRPGSRIWSSSS